MKIEESVQEILSQKQAVVGLFYDEFLRRYPEVREFFSEVDLKHQAVMLTMALVLLENHYSHSYPATDHYLKVLGHRHYLWNVPPELYPKFRDCLLETLAQFHDNDWDDVLHSQWHAAIDKASQTMLEGYKQPYEY